MARWPQSLRYVLEHNRVETPGFGLLPCAGLYAEVVNTGTAGEGDEVRIG
jgi:hypothetical protein